MIVYGTKATLAKSELTTDTCPSCGTQGSVQMNVFNRYAHVFWIPFFPIGKTGVSQCQHCKQVLKLKEMPASLKLSYDNIKGHAKIPVWHFSGLVLLAALIAFATIHGNEQRKITDQTVAAPKANDVFQVKTTDTKTKEEVYTLIKITKVAGDSVYFCYSKYQTNQESGLDDLAKKDYDSDLRVMPKSELAKLDANGDIIGIEQ